MRVSRRGRRRLLALVAFAAVVVLAWTTVSSWRQAAQAARLAEARVDGLALYAQRDYAGALTQLSAYLSRRQNDVEALLAFADARSKVPVENGRHIAEAIGLYNAALQLEPGNRAALEHLMLLYERVGRHVEWLAIAERLLSIDPDHIEAQRLSALAHYFEFQYDLAARRAERLIRIEPHEVRWREFYLQMLREQGVPVRELLNVCEGWISVHEGDGRFHLVKARLLLGDGQMAQAREAALEAAERGADSHETLQQMISLLETLGLRQEAAAVLADADRLHEEAPWVHEVAVRRLWQIGASDEALAVIDRLDEQGDLSAAMLRWKSALLMLQHRYDEADAAAARFASAARPVDGVMHDRDRAWIAAIGARLRLAESGWKNVLEEYQRAVSLDPRNPVLHALCAEAYAMLGEHDLAAISLERAVHADPYWMVAQARYAEALLRVGKHAQAARLALDVLRRSEEPDLALCLIFARAWLASGLSAAELGLAREAEDGRSELLRFLSALFEEAPQHPDVAELLVRAQLLEGRTSLAVDLIERIIAEERASEPMFVALAALSEQRGLGLEEKVIAEAKRRYGDTLPLAEAEARSLHHRGRTIEAIALIRGVEEADATQRGRALAGFLAWAGHPAAAGALREMLDAAGLDAQQAMFVLDQPAAWTDADLAQRAIGVLAATLGETAPRTALARARYALEFQPNDRAAIAGAMVLVSSVLQRAPDSLPALRLMADLFLAGENPDRNAAIRHLQRALSAHPGNAEILPDLIAMLQEQGDYTAAETHLRSMSEVSRRRPDLQHRELQLLESQGDYEAIVVRLNDRIEAVNACEVEKLILASSLHRTGRHQQAALHFGELLAMEHPSPIAIAAAAHFHATQGRFEEGLALVEKLFDQEQSGRAASIVAAYHRDNGDPREGTRWYELAVELSPGDVSMHLRLAEHALALGEHRQAFAAARAGLELDPKHDGLRGTLVLAGLHLGETEREAAHAALQARDWTDAALRETLSIYTRLAARDARDIADRDLAELRDLVSRHPSSIDAWRLAITTHVQVGQLHEAARLASLAAGRFPTRAEPAEMATRLLIRLGEPAEALTMARLWRDRSRHRPIEPDFMMARLQVELGRHDTAVRQIEPYADRMIAEQNVAPDRLQLFLRALAGDGQMERLAAVLRRLMQEDARWARAGLNLMDAVSVRHAPRLLRLVEPALTDDPDAALALALGWVDLASATRHSAHEQRVLELAERIGRTERLAVPAALLTATILQQRGDLDHAVQTYRAALQREPDNVMALNNLAYLLTASGEYAEAVELSRRALQQRPDDPDLLDTHALALLAAGEAEAARRHAERALSGRPEDPAVLLTLTRALVAEERMDEAGRYLERASRAADRPGRAAGPNEASLRSALREMRQALEPAHADGRERDDGR